MDQAGSRIHNSHKLSIGEKVRRKGEWEVGTVESYVFDPRQWDWCYLVTYGTNPDRTLYEVSLVPESLQTRFSQKGG